MKKYIKILFFVALFTGIFAFHNRIQKANTFDYKNQIYELQYGYIEDFGAHPSKQTFDFDLHLSSASKSNFTTHTINYIYLDLHSEEKGMIKEGTYRFKEENDKLRESFTMTNAEVLINYDLNTKTGESLYAVDGNVEIKVIDGKHSVKFRLVLDNGEEMEGVYQGKLLDWETE